ncbi:MAG: UDP-N-acetylmuramate dehydrogenase [Clostridia bacterium]|nr:UDP-N-acetylmuramate dehydrogenase [Clostridia bacterium]
MNGASLIELESSLRAKDEHLVLKRDADMARCTTLHLGGPADLMASPSNAEQIQLLLMEAHRLNVPVTIIGNGSNLLVKDGGIRGLVIRVCRDMQAIEVSGDRIRVQAGAMMSTLSMAAADCHLGGLTFASGIPGTVGGGAYMNAGAYGGEMSQVVTLVEGFNMVGEPFRYGRPDMRFAHRYSRLMKENKLITHVTVQLPQGKREELLAEMVEFNRRRAEKQPLTQFSAGSTFKRPPEGYASQMVDECGLKGYTIGGAQVSEKHAGFLVNRGGTAADFLALMGYVQRVVYEQKGVMLEPEVRILGEDAPVARA